MSFFNLNIFFYETRPLSDLEADKVTLLILELLVAAKKTPFGRLLPKYFPLLERIISLVKIDKKPRHSCVRSEHILGAAIL